MPINLWHQIVRSWFFGVMMKVILAWRNAVYRLMWHSRNLIERYERLLLPAPWWSCYPIYPIKLFLDGCLIDSCVSTICCFLLWQPLFCVVGMVIKRGLCELRALELSFKCNTYMCVCMYIYVDVIKSPRMHRTIGVSTTPKRWCHSG